MRECARCGGLQMIIGARRDVVHARRCEACASAVCPHCEGLGRISEIDEFGYSVARDCDCRALDLKVRAVCEARLPGRYAEATFASFQPPPGLQHARTDAHRFANEFQEGDPGRLYYGPVGTGKTHLLVAILRHLLVMRSIRCRFVEFVHLLADLRASFDGGRPHQVMAPLIEVPVLAVDELGKGRSARKGDLRGTPMASEWAVTVLDELISKRYNAGRTTLFTTNFYPRFVPDGVAPPQNEMLDDRIGHRIYSRLQEMCVPVFMGGEDFRRRGPR